MKSHSDSIARKLGEFAALCRRLGTPATVQRRAVLQAVLEHDDHPTADQVYEAARHRVPGISRTTVYRALDALVAMGLVRCLHHSGPAARFDGRTHRHHHLICRHCNLVIDLENPRLDRVRVADIDSGEFEIEDFSVHLTGICPACRKART